MINVFSLIPYNEVDIDKCLVVFYYIIYVKC